MNRLHYLSEPDQRWRLRSTLVRTHDEGGQAGMKVITRLDWILQNHLT